MRQSSVIFGAIALVLAATGSAVATFVPISAGQIYVGSGSLNPPVAVTVSGDATISGAGAITLTKILTTPTVFASLPTCNSASDGMRAFITDASTVTFNTNVSAGGANHVPVFCSGATSTWKVG